MLLLQIALVFVLAIQSFARHPETIEDPRLHGFVWYLRTMNHVPIVSPRNRFHFEFQKDTTDHLYMTGWINCNGFLGSYELPQANTISMTKTSITTAECPPPLPDTVNLYPDADHEFWRTINRAYSYTLTTLDSNRPLTALLMYDRDNVPLLVFYNQYVPAYQYSFPLVFR